MKLSTKKQTGLCLRGILWARVSISNCVQYCVKILVPVINCVKPEMTDEEGEALLAEWGYESRANINQHFAEMNCKIEKIYDQEQLIKLLTLFKSLREYPMQSIQYVQVFPKKAEDFLYRYGYKNVHVWSTQDVTKPVNISQHISITTIINVIGIFNANFATKMRLVYIGWIFMMQPILSFYISKYCAANILKALRK